MYRQLSIPGLGCSWCSATLQACSSSWQQKGDRTGSSFERLFKSKTSRLSTIRLLTTNSFEELWLGCSTGVIAMSHRNGGESSVSFRITNPTGSTSSRPQASTSSASRHRSSHGRGYSHQRYASDSESEDDDFGRFERRKAKDESITGIDSKGIRYVQTCTQSQLNQQLKYMYDLCSSTSSAKKDKPLVIPTAPNKDFRQAALELRAQKEGRQRFIPGQVSSMQGGEAKQRVLTEEEREFLESESHVQRIGDKVASGGIRQRKAAAPVNASSSQDAEMDGDKTPVPGTNGFSRMLDAEESSMSGDADALALRELLQEHDAEEERETKVHIIPQAPAVTEEEAYALDVAQRPDTPDLEAYQRVPIEDFGAALLRGMGGGNKPRPKVEAYVPKPRTALLGIGAKSREETFGKDWVAQQDNVKKGSNKREQMRFMPLQKVERPSSSGTASPAPVPIEAGRSEGSSSRRRRDDDYSDTEDKDRRRHKSSRRSYDQESEDEARRRRRKRDRSRSPRDEGKERHSKSSSRRDERDSDAGARRGGKDEREDRSRRERDDGRERARYRDEKEGGSVDRQDRQPGDRDRKYRDDDRDRDRRR